MRSLGRMGLGVTLRHKRVTKADVNAALSFYSKLTGKPQPAALIPSPPLKKRKATQATPREHNEQVRYVAWFRRTYPDVLIFAIPNGGARDAVTGWKLKQEGVMRDVPDLFVPKFRLFIEMKRVDGERRRGQKIMATYLTLCGYRHIFGMGAEDAREKTLRLLAEK